MMPRKSTIHLSTSGHYNQQHSSGSISRNLSGRHSLLGQLPGVHSLEAAKSRSPENYQQQNSRLNKAQLNRRYIARRHKQLVKLKQEREYSEDNIYAANR